MVNKSAAVGVGTVALIDVGSGGGSEDIVKGSCTVLGPLPDASVPVGKGAVVDVILM